MEKLIKLLNKFERETFPEEHEYVKFPDGTDDDGGYWYYRERPNMGENKGFNYSSRSDKRNCEINQLLIISKEFGFIKWLVENDKIDRDSEDYPIKRHGPYFDDDVLGIIQQNCNTYEDDIKKCYSDYETLLMLLAIQEQPIDFLCSILN